MNQLDENSIIFYLEELAALGGVGGVSLGLLYKQDAEVVDRHRGPRRAPPAPLTYRYQPPPMLLRLGLVALSGGCILPAVLIVVAVIDIAQQSAHETRTGC